MDNLDQKIQQGIETYMRNKQFNYSKIQSHEHNGVDTVKVSEKDLIPRETFAGFLTVDGSGILYIKNISNPRTIEFYGIAEDNYGGTPSQHIIITGKVIIGKATQLIISNINELIPDSSTTSQYLQMSNSMYVDESDIANTTTVASSGSFIWGEDTVGNVVSATVTSVTPQYIAIYFSISPTWYIQGTITIN